MAGTLYIFEGIDHSGKTTGLLNIRKHINKYHPNKKVIFTREPGGFDDPVCEKIRELILDPKNEIADITEAYLYAASRAQHVQRIIKWLEDGHDVFCDRFIYSSLVYQGISRGIGVDKIIAINNHAIGSLLSDYDVKIIFYKIDLDTYIKRKMNQTSLDRLEQNNLDFFDKIIKGYDIVFSTSDVKIIDALKPISQVKNELIKYLNL